MRNVLKIISFIGLALTLIPSIFVFNDMLSLDHYKQLMLLGTILWIVNAPFWINKKKESEN